MGREEKENLDMPDKKQAPNYNWKDIGKLWASLTTLYSLCSKLWKEMGVDTGIIEWFTEFFNSGGYTPEKSQFLIQKIKLVGYYYLNEAHDVTVAEITRISEENHWLPKAMKIEKCEGKLFIDGEEVHIKAFEPLDVNPGDSYVSIQQVLDVSRSNVNYLGKDIFDFLLTHPQFIPDEWKKERDLLQPTIYFLRDLESGDQHNWGLGSFRALGMYWSGGKLNAKSRPVDAAVKEASYFAYTKR